MTDPFRNYDAWLERPYTEAAERGHAAEQAWERRGTSPEAVEPPHRPGGDCPRCGEPGALALAGAADEPALYCGSCGADVDPGEAPTFDALAWAEDQAEAAAEADAEARWEDGR